MKITVARARDVLMLALGCGGMTRELFLVDELDMRRVWVSIGLLLGPAVLLSWWSIRAGIPPRSDAPPPSSESSSRSPVS